jgi:hypothetical protein
MEHLIQRMAQDPLYALVIPMTIALHAFERDNQDLSKPRIFVREHDEDGFTVGFNINKVYRNTFGKQVDAIMTGLNKNPQERVIEVLNWLEDPDIAMLIPVMGHIDGGEGEIYNAIKKAGGPEKARLVDEMPLLIERSYDNRGIPIAYKLNSRIISVADYADGKFNMEIKGLPITDKEIRASNIDELLKRLTL